MGPCSPASSRYPEPAAGTSSKPYEKKKEGERERETGVMENILGLCDWDLLCSDCVTYLPSTALVRVVSSPKASRVFNILSLRSSLLFRLIRNIWERQREKEKEHDKGCVKEGNRERKQQKRGTWCPIKGKQAVSGSVNQLVSQSISLWASQSIYKSKAFSE